MKKRLLHFNFKNLLTVQNFIILAVVATGLFLRSYQLPERFLYGHDQDLSSWFVKDILVNGHLRLIGQETSTAGIFIGPIFYYLMSIFYRIFGMDPIGGAYLTFVISIFGIGSLYYVVSKIWGKNTATFALVIYCLSYYTVFNDREVVPTMPVIIWTVWFIYTLFLLFTKKYKKGFLFAGILIGLIWHLNFALVLPLPLLLVSVILVKKKPDLKDLELAAMGFLVMSLPLILFEMRHGFSQSKALISSLTTPQSDVISGFLKYQRVFELMSKNLHGLLIGSLNGIEPAYVSYLFIFVFILLLYKKHITTFWSTIFVAWVLTYFLFFANYSKIVSEYYVNGSLIVLLIIASIALTKIFESVKYRHICLILIFLFSVFSLRKFAITPINKSGYVQRREIIAEIKRDSGVRGYPCVSLSFITDPGYNLGYRYFTYLAGLKIKPVSDFVPVYTIVFPLKPIFPTDQTRGGIGLIYPDYDHYEPDLINEKCSGDDYNLSEPMWGFPQ